MSSELIPYSDLTRMAMAMAKSGLFGLKTADQAIALMLVAQSEGRHPASAARDYDIIQGRPAKKAEAMLRDFLNAGGRVEWIELSDAKAVAKFSHPQGGTVTLDWDHDRAKRAGLDGKDMYKKFPRQMLRSRCISEGVRSVYPTATGGLYEPTEVEAMIDVTPADTTAQLDQFAAAEAPSLLEQARAAARKGRVAFGDFWVPLKQDQRNELRPDMEELQQLAEAADDEPEPVGR